MSDTDALQGGWPTLGRGLKKLRLASLPTPVRTVSFDDVGGRHRICIKQDNLTGELYGGNKVRKLEYALRAACDHRCRTVATFGTVGSHHALATALYARKLGFECICFLSHQVRTDSVPATLNMHLANGTELVRFGGTYAARIATLRKHLRGREAWIVPAGGSSWAGTVGFVNAALELAQQVESGALDLPDRLYVATGTMGTAAGLALGLALAGMPTEVHAVRISHNSITDQEKLQRLCAKTAYMMHRLDAGIPDDLANRVRLRLRHDFFAGGYAQTDQATEHAIAIACRQMNLMLEPTYTGKAMAALLADCREPEARGRTVLFWHSYHAKPLPVSADAPLDPQRLPAEFMRYFS